MNTVWQLCKNDKIKGKNDESLATPMSNNALDSVKFGAFAIPSYKLPNSLRCRSFAIFNSSGR